MKKEKYDREYIKKKMKELEELRLNLNKAYEKHGNTNEVVKMSQELDKHILAAQTK